MKESSVQTKTSCQSHSLSSFFSEELNGRAKISNRGYPQADEASEGIK